MSNMTLLIVGLVLVAGGAPLIGYLLPIWLIYKIGKFIIGYKG
jgi:hypothetical protein